MDQTNQKKKIGVFSLVSIGTGSMIGAGIFSTMGVGITQAGRGVVLAFLLAQALVFIQYIASWVMVGTFDVPGGNYGQRALVMPPFMTGAGAVSMVVSNFTRSVQGLSVASYICLLIPALTDYQNILAFVTLTVFFLATIPGTAFLAKIQNVMVVLMYIALALFIVYGVIHFDPSAYDGDPLLPQGIMGLLMGTATLSYACNGVMNLLSYGDEVEGATRKIPLAMVISTLVGTLIYVFLGFASTHCMSYSQISNQNMGYVAQIIMPDALYKFFVIGGALFALATTMLGGIGAMKWPIFRSAQDGWLPKVMTKTTKSGFPWVVMLVMYLVAVIPIIGGFTLDSVVALITVPNTINALVFSICCWRVPEKFPNTWSKNVFHMSAPVFRFLLILSVAAGGVLAMFSLKNQTTGLMIANIVMCIGLYVYGYFRYKSGAVKLEAREIYKD